MEIEVMIGMIEFYPAEGTAEEDSMITLLIDYEEESLLKQLENKHYYLESNNNVVVKKGIRYTGDNWIDTLEEQNYELAVKQLVKDSLTVVDENFIPAIDLEDMTAEELMAKIGVEDDMGTVG